MGPIQGDDRGEESRTIALNQHQLSNDLLSNLGPTYTEAQTATTAKTITRIDSRALDEALTTAPE